MIQFLEILGDVMRIATFQWRGDRRHHVQRTEQRPATRWAARAERHPFRRSRP
ncbi:hypothetical protein NKK48_04680 [Mesorhizobium sp. C386A]|uniref:hypothetical protein n=1 Tax=unclassified Mesorhizobium TaxID=325217 RepID=UPI0003CF2B14|nr:MULTISPECIES: hypothetical protein [unclassified Mesorhizobium]ESY10560.1 hypothetical protein X752_16805 [Mesorhizobium sp. LNJC398B00]ESY36404.1 hypothetical protein X748_12440 [Mesorhizobium sp. LNJC386A00]